MLPHPEPLVRREHNQRVLQLPRLFQHRQHPPDPLIQRLHTVIRLMHKILKRLPLPLILLFPKRRSALPRIRFPIRPLHPSLRLLQKARLPGPRPKQIRRPLHRVTVMLPLVPIRRRRRPVNRPVTQPQKPRLLRIPLLTLQKIHRPLRVLVRRIPRLHPLHPIFHHDLIIKIVPRILRMLRPIPNDLMIPVPPQTRIRPRMPLPDLHRLIPLLPQHLRPILTHLRIIRAPRIRPLQPHRLNPMRMPPRQQRRPRRHAP